METKNCIPENSKKIVEEKTEEKKLNIDQGERGKKKKNKKKHNSALLAASKARSALSRVDANSYKDGNFANIGTNFSYRDDQ